MSTGEIGNLPAKHADAAFLLYEIFGVIERTANLDKVLNHMVPLLAKGETAINAELADLANIDPGQLDQSRLMAAQMNMSRWQLAVQLISNFCSGIASGLKSTVQNIGR